jgi:hypothetical protein
VRPWPKAGVTAAAQHDKMLAAAVNASERPAGTASALETAAGILAVRLVTAKAATASEIEGAFAMLVGEGVGALIVGGDLFYWAKQIIPLAAHYALPAMYDFREMVEAGGLISYEGDFYPGPFNSEVQRGDFWR